MAENSFLQLKKAEKALLSEPSFDFRMVMMGDCATQHIATAIRGAAFLQGMRIDLLDADYNQIDAMIIDQDSELYTHQPQFVLLMMCGEQLERAFRKAADKKNFAETWHEKIVSNWQTISDRMQTNLIQFSFLELNDAVFGDYALKTEESFLFQVKKLNYLLACSCQSRKNVFFLDLNQTLLELGRERFSSEKLYYIAKMPITTEALPSVAKRVVDLIAAIRGRIKKCVICDLDNTLWGGVIGDDGIQGIQVGELGTGHAFEALQTWLKALKERGILLGVCSKNDEKNAKEPFLHHPEMVLSLDDFSIFVANWEDKASNLFFIQQTLNIGMDSIVFLDDNPFERNLVRTAIPEITVPELPEDPAEYLPFLKRLNLFDTGSFSEADKDRTRQYQAEANRIVTQRQFESYDDYLQSLEMVATVSPFDEFQTPRIAQLTQRSNQFNLRTVRCTEDDVARLAKDPDHITRYFMLRDKFGDHGLISVLVLKRQDAETLFVENWLMSCRVLKRGMEEYIVNTMAAIAREEGFSRIMGEYLRTPKNNMVSDLYVRLGFTDVGNNQYVLDVNSYHPHRCFIK